MYQSLYYRVMPTSMVATLLLHGVPPAAAGLPKAELVERFAALRADVARCKRDVGFSGADEDAVDLVVSL